MPLYLLALLALVTLSGCETPPAQPQQGAYTTGESGIQQARQYLRQAASETSPQKDATLLQAARLFSINKKPDRALSTLKSINPEVLADSDYIEFSLLFAELAFIKSDLSVAQLALENPRIQSLSETLDADSRKRWFQLNGQLQNTLGNYHKSLFFFTRAAALEADSNLIATINNRIWKVLSRQSRSSLEHNMALSNDDIIKGWYSLALAARDTQGDLGQQIDAINSWKTRYASHPAARVMPTNLKAVMSVDRDIPRNIALLLPRSEKYKLATDTLSQGLLAAYYDTLKNSGQVPEIRFYDTDGDSIQNLYAKAVADGADLIIGPLRKEKLVELMNGPPPEVPVLALNFIEGQANPHGSIFQFGLSIEDEAAQVADLAWKQGLRAAMTVTPDTSWGNEARDKFIADWQARGGQLIANITYGSNQQDYAELLKPAFLLHHSRERATRLRQTLGKRIESNPSRRRDLDMIFLIANAQQGHQIKPSLDYLYAADLPVYATSMINDGKGIKSLDRDLNGIRFPAMPWSVKAFDTGNLRPGGNLSGSYRNLFALGADAYELHQWLSVMKAIPDVTLNGHTGVLSLKEDNHIVRTLPWAHFKNGEAIPLATR